MNNKWTRERIIRDVLQREGKGLPLNLGEHGISQQLYQAGNRIFGSWPNAIQAAGIPWERVRSKEKWSPAKIINMIRHLARRPRSMSTKQPESHYGSMLSAARRIFGSWPKALMAAGVNPAKFQRVVPWTRDRIIEAILTRALRNKSLTARSTQPRSLVEAGARLFGSWMAAVEAAGLDPKSVAVSVTVPAKCTEPVDAATSHMPGQTWTSQMVIAAIEARLREEKPLNSYAVYTEFRGLQGGAIRIFGSWRNALLAAGLNPDDHRRRGGIKRRSRTAIAPATIPAQKSQASGEVRPEKPV